MLMESKSNEVSPWLNLKQGEEAELGHMTRFELELLSLPSCRLILEVSPASGTSLLSWVQCQAGSDTVRKFADYNQRVNQLFPEQDCLWALVPKSDPVWKNKEFVP